MQNLFRLLRLVVASVGVIALWGGAHIYLYARLVRDPAIPLAAFLTGSLVALALIAVWALSHRAPRALARPVHVVGYTWMGLILPLLVFLAWGDVARLLAPPPEDPLFIARLQAGLSFSLAVALGFYGWLVARRPAPLKKVEVELERWPAGLDGFRIVQISDLHIDAVMTRREVESLVARVNALQPDLVALTGDLIDGTPRSLGDKIEPLRELKARQGVWFVTGNHEYYSGGDRWIAAFEGLGLGLLQNERVVLGDDRGQFALAGVPDWRGGDFGERHRPRLSDVVSSHDPALELVLLAHQPRQFKEAAALGVGLQLSGHTHGGQLWPFTHLVSLAEPFVAGLYRTGRSQLYVSRGTGTWGPRVRTLAPHELTELTLRRTR